MTWNSDPYNNGYHPSRHLNWFVAKFMYDPIAGAGYPINQTYAYAYEPLWTITWWIAKSSKPSEDTNTSWKITPTAHLPSFTAIPKPSLLHPNQFKKKICVAITVCPKNHSHLRAATGHLFWTTPQRGRHRQVGRPVAPGAGHPWLKNMVWSPLAAITWRNLRVSTSLFKS